MHTASLLPQIAAFTVRSHYLELVQNLTVCYQQITSKLASASGVDKNYYRAQRSARYMLYFSLWH